MIGLFGGRPDFGKVAIDGEWERAVTFAPGEVPEVPADATDVACEAFFGQAFFGVRYRSPAAVPLFARALTRADFLGAFADLPLARDLDFVELGAEGAWRSVGPLRVDPAAPFAEIWGQVRQASVWFDTAHDKALEFTFANGDGTSHWFALPVSRDRRIDQELLREALAAYVVG